MKTKLDFMTKKELLRMLQNKNIGKPIEFFTSRVYAGENAYKLISRVENGRTLFAIIENS